MFSGCSVLGLIVSTISMFLLCLTYKRRFSNIYLVLILRNLGYMSSKSGTFSYSYVPSSLVSRVNWTLQLPT
jgi:hypothetical protein